MSASETSLPSPSRTVALPAALRSAPVVLGLAILLLLAAIAGLAPWLSTVDPIQFDVVERLRPPSGTHWFGTDMMGRDIYSRVLYGGRISLIVGLGVAVIATVVGLAIGLACGYLDVVDLLVMRIMDGLMAIPAILLAIALMALAGSSVPNVIVAVAIPQIPIVARLVRGVVLSTRELAYVEAAIASGTGALRIMTRHMLPGTLTPLIVQSTYICAAAIISEASLSFLGAGTPPEVPSWGNIIGEGRAFFPVAPWLILIPSGFLALTVLAVNLLGDGLRDLLDPRQAER